MSYPFMFEYEFSIQIENKEMLLLLAEAVGALEGKLDDADETSPSGRRSWTFTAVEDHVSIEDAIDYYRRTDWGPLATVAQVKGWLDERPERQAEATPEKIQKWAAEGAAWWASLSEEDRARGTTGAYEETGVTQ